jgi:hypothetical protein
VPGTPWWLRCVPPLAGVYLAVIVAGAVASLGSQPRFDSLVVANGLLVVIYMAIGFFILRTQLANRPSMAGWSVSGLCLSVIFPTCALMHAIWGAYDVSGRYHADVHGLMIDWLSVPAGLYFLWVVRRLYRDTLSDWNEGPGEVSAELSSTGVS